jgi:GntR family transcriptional regulator/MocR family aminotransferase
MLTEFHPEADAPLYQQLYEHLRTAILSGQLKPGAKLPSTRALADELNISRNTVLNAYDQLISEGYLEGSTGSGTYVTRQLPETTLFRPKGRRAAPKATPATTPPRLSKASADLVAIPYLAEPIRDAAGRTQTPFHAGMPALDAFPYKTWERLLEKQARGLRPEHLMYQERAGLRRLREAIAEQVALSRQVRCAPEQVIIVSGSQSGLDLTARVLLNPGDAAWMEDPGYLGARGAFIAAGTRLVPVPVDDEGIDVAAGERLAPHARLVYVTPSHQFPLGRTMSLARRLALIDWAARANAVILEDDYDGEYRYSGRPLASLQGLDTASRVIYMGTFSKVLFPSLRLGYLIVPTALVDAFIAMRSYTDVHVPALEQAVLADFITEGHFIRHLRRTRALYAERRTQLMNALSGLPLELDSPPTGLHLVGWLPAGMDDREAAQHAAARGVYTTAISQLRIGGEGRKGLLLGFAGVNERQMREGAAALDMALKELATTTGS